MRIFTHIGLVLGLVSLAVTASAEVELGGRKDQVIGTKNRAAVLEVAEQYLEPEDADKFAAAVEDLKNPFVFEQYVAPSPEDVADEEGEEPKEAVSRIIYDDAEVLDLIAKSLADQIRGTMGMGSTYYLQLDTGGLMKAGTAFPARIPQNKNKTYDITLTEITLEEFTLRLGDIEQRYPIPKKEVKSSGKIEFDSN